MKNAPGDFQLFWRHRPRPRTVLFLSPSTRQDYTGIHAPDIKTPTPKKPMKLIIRSVIAFLFVIAFAYPSLAQSPKLAIKIGSPSGKCFPLTLKNLQTTPLTASAAYLVVFDQTNCKKTCDSKIAINKT